MPTLADITSFARRFPPNANSSFVAVGKTSCRETAHRVDHLYDDDSAAARDRDRSGQRQQGTPGNSLNAHVATSASANRIASVTQPRIVTHQGSTRQSSVF